MDPKHDEPKMGLDVGRKTTQLNLWMVVGLLVFVAASAFLIFRVMRDPPDSTHEMQTDRVP